MFLRNWYKAINSNMGQKSAGFKDYNGNNATFTISASKPPINIFNRDSYGLKNPLTSGNYGEGVLFGTGTTAPTLDDYRLAGEIISGVAITFTHSVTHDDNGLTAVAIYTITNNKSEPITIGEVAICSACGTSPDGYGNGYGLLERTVLDSPITIEAGGVGQLTYELKSNYPTE